MMKLLWADGCWVMSDLRQCIDVGGSTDVTSQVH